MTDETMSLRAVIEDSPDADLLREMIGFAARRLSQPEVEGLTGAITGWLAHRPGGPAPRHTTLPGYDL
jgi:hypothetical protein